MWRSLKLLNHVADLHRNFSTSFLALMFRANVSVVFNSVLLLLLSVSPRL